MLKIGNADRDSDGRVVGLEMAVVSAVVVERGKARILGGEIEGRQQRAMLRRCPHGFGQGMLFGDFDGGARSTAFVLRIVFGMSGRQGGNAVGIELNGRKRQASEIGEMAAENVGGALRLGCDEGGRGRQTSLALFRSTALSTPSALALRRRVPFAEPGSRPAASG